MEPHLIWFIVAGLPFISMALAGSAIARLPLTTAMLYLGIGVLLGPTPRACCSSISSRM